MLKYAIDHEPTLHYRYRVAERALRASVEEFLMRWGTDTHAAGATHITLVRRHLPKELRGTEQATRAEGGIIIVSDDGALITCYRRNDAWRFVRRKARGRPRRRSHKEG